MMKANNLHISLAVLVLISNCAHFAMAGFFNHFREAKFKPVLNVPTWAKEIVTNICIGYEVSLPFKKKLYFNVREIVPQQFYVKLVNVRNRRETHAKRIISAEITSAKPFCYDVKFSVQSLDKNTEYTVNLVNNYRKSHKVYKNTSIMRFYVDPRVPMEEEPKFDPGAILRGASMPAMPSNPKDATLGSIGSRKLPAPLAPVESVRPPVNSWDAIRTSYSNSDLRLSRKSGDQPAPSRQQRVRWADEVGTVPVEPFRNSISATDLPSMLPTNPDQWESEPRTFWKLKKD